MPFTTEDHRFLQDLFAAADAKRKDGFDSVYAKLDKQGERIGRMESALGLAEQRIGGLEAENESVVEQKKSIVRIIIGGIVTLLAGLGLATIKENIEK